MDKENLKNEMVFRAICSYSKDGVSNFTVGNLTNVASKDVIQARLKLLEIDNKIQKISKNGFMPRYRILEDELCCPDFICDKNIVIDDKLVLLQLYNNLESYSYLTKSELVPIIETSDNNISRFLTRIRIRYSKEWYEILNASLIIKNSIDEEYLINTDAGYQYKSKRPDKVYKCKYCEETDPDKFYTSSAAACKKCKAKIAKQVKSIEHSLYLRTLNSFKSRSSVETYNITESYIKELLEKQDYKCYYSGLKFNNNSEDKLHYPTVDRVDSSKGYIKDNIVICSWTVNNMKNDMSVEGFKFILKVLVENIPNF